MCAVLSLLCPLTLVSIRKYNFSGEPNPLHDVSVYADGFTLVASWDEPFSLEGEELSYVVYITNTATGAQTEVNVTTTRFVLLERDCAEYEFTVFSKNSYSRSQNGVTGRDRISSMVMKVRVVDAKKPTNS